MSKIIPKSDKPVNLKTSMMRGHLLVQAQPSTPLHSDGRRPPMPVPIPKATAVK